MYPLLVDFRQEPGQRVYSVWGQDCQCHLLARVLLRVGEELVRAKQLKSDACDLKETGNKQAWDLKGNFGEQLATSGAVKLITRESQERLSIPNNPFKLCKVHFKF